MKRLYLILTLLALFSAYSHAQIYIDNQGNVYDQRENNRQEQTTNTRVNNASEKSKFDVRRLEFGGSFGLQFGDYTLVNISPQVGYRLSNKFSAGVGLGYTYYGDDIYGEDYKEHFASFNVYGRLYPVDFIVLSVMPEISRMWQTREYLGNKESYSKFVPSIVVGAGVRFGSLTAQIKYDVVQDKYSPYGNNIFYSVGYIFSF